VIKRFSVTMMVVSMTQTDTKIYQFTDGDVNDKEDRQGDRERCQIC
jgi:hypothetical protein